MVDVLSLPRDMGKEWLVRWSAEVASHHEERERERERPFAAVERKKEEREKGQRKRERKKESIWGKPENDYSAIKLLEITLLSP